MQIMKKIIFAILTIMSFNCQSQTITETKNIVEGTLGKEKWKIIQRIKNNDTTTCFYFSFQNEKYTQITDLGTFFYLDSVGLTEFVNSLDILSQKPDKSGVSIDLSSGGKVSLFDFSNEIYLIDKNNKHTKISKEDAKKFVVDIRKYYKLLK
jgi:hypothetical protein